MHASFLQFRAEEKQGRRCGKAPGKTDFPVKKRSLLRHFIPVSEKAQTERRNKVTFRHE
jgi:hypothetical protein